MRVGIIVLLHESNTFVSRPTTLDHFRQDLYAVGPDIFAAFRDAHHEIGGFIEGLESNHIAAVPIFAARAVPSGAVTDITLSELLKTLFGELDRAGPLDGLLLAVHGAMASQSHRDADGYWLTALRQRVGKDFPLVATIDPHANLSRSMVRSTNALVAYKTNPHLDQRARGADAADLMARMLRREIRPHMAAALPPLAINIERQGTNDDHLVPLYDLASSMEQRRGVLSASIVLGFPYADTEDMGAAAIVVTDGDPVLADKSTTALAESMWSRRETFVGKLVAVEDALDRAELLEGPVCLLDMGDNVGGGSPADGTVLARAIHRRKLGPAFVCLCDPASAARAIESGVGSCVRMQVGGRSESRHGPPLDAEFSVLGLYDGRFTEDQPRHGGIARFDQGPTAVVRAASGLTVMLTTHRMPPFSLHQLTTFGIDPGAFQILVAKGVHAPLGAYAPVCRHFIRVNTPGCTTADIANLNYVHRRQPMFPFERETTWTASVIDRDQSPDGAG